VVDSLKALDPKRPIREADISETCSHFAYGQLGRELSLRLRYAKMTVRQLNSANDSEQSGISPDDIS
jgi:hypothetical protein